VIGIFVLKTRLERLQEALQRFRDLLAVARGTRPPSAPGPTPSLPRPGPQPEPSGQGSLIVPEGSAPAPLSDAIRRYFPQDEWINAVRVAYYESGWNRTAVRDTRDRAGGQCGVRIWLPEVNSWGWTEHSIGYFQINACAHGGDYGLWTDTYANVEKAADLWQSGGWSHWLITARKIGLL
jgi:hypothetical protein